MMQSYIGTKIVLAEPIAGRRHTFRRAYRLLTERERVMIAPARTTE